MGTFKEPTLNRESVLNKETDKTSHLFVYSPQEFEHLITDESGRIDERFLSADEGGVFKLFYPEDLYNSHEQTSLYFAVFQDEIIVGIGKMRKSPSNENAYETSVSIDPVFQGRGFARMIMAKQFELAKKNGWTLRSTYTAEGKEKLKELNHELAKAYGVELIED